MKVLWLANVPSPYRVDFFNKLGRECELTVLFEKRTSEERDISWLNYNFLNFKGIILKGVSVTQDSAFCPTVLRYLKNNRYDYIVLTNFTTPTGMLAIEYLRRRGISYWLESDGGFAKSGKGLKERVKRHFIKGAAAYFSTGSTHDEYYLQYGAKKDKLFRYPFTSIAENDILSAPATTAQKKEIRKKLNMTEQKIILSVGQFVYRKGFDLLLEACKSVDKSVGIYFVGGEATQEYLDIVAKYAMTNVHFVGFKGKGEIAEYYKAADIFVLPTREDIWGLVINEAMAYGLPVITTDMCAAGLELVENGVNGYIIPSENVTDLKSKLVGLVEDERLINNMACSSLQKISDYTVEKMAQIHIGLFSKI